VANNYKNKYITKQTIGKVNKKIWGLTLLVRINEGQSRFLNARVIPFKQWKTYSVFWEDKWLGNYTFKQQYPIPI
jgi:hypothetical protein